MPGLTIDNVSKSFGETSVLRNVSLEVNEAKLLVLLGPSGCGKTTLLRLIAGLESNETGEIFIGPKRVDQLVPKKRNVAMVFQNYSLYPHMTVEKNLAFPLKIAGESKNEINSRVRETAELIGLTDRLKHKPGQLSGGQRQRVALGRAVIRKPDIFLLDEPLSNLDAELRVRMRHEIVQLQQRLKVTTVYVTHDQEEALTMADEIVLLNDGVIVQKGTPEELYAKPSSLFAASFIGQPRINLIPAQVENHKLIPFGFPVVNQKLCDRPEGLVIGIRPEAIELGPSGEFLAKVESCEYLGDHYTARIYFNSIRLTVSGLTTAIETRREVSFNLKSRALHFFDGATGERLED